MRRVLNILSLMTLLSCVVLLVSCAATNPTLYITQEYDTPQGEALAANLADEPGMVLAGDAESAGDVEVALDEVISESGGVIDEQWEPHEQPAALGQPLVELEQPPTRTLARFEIESSAPHPLYHATIEPFGTRGALGDNPPRELIARIVSWELAQDGVEDQLPDLAGRNASFQMNISSEEMQPLLFGGQHGVIVRILSDGSTGFFAIEEVR